MNAKRQRGAALLLVIVGLLALMAMVGLAIDSGHLTLNKARLQSTVDAAALAAAKKLDQTGSEDQASTAARAVFDANAKEHPELKKVLSGKDISIEYSEKLAPFSPGTAPANYVRVKAANFTMWTSFTSLVGVKQLKTGATAVAGPSPTIVNACNVAPLVVCGNPGSSAKDYWGFKPDAVHVLKMAAGSDPIGPGNFQIINLGGPGANIVRKNLAGGYGECVDIKDSVDTQPGVLTGPVTQGLNTRFNQYSGGLSPDDYPPDLVTTPPSPQLTYDDKNNVIKQGTKIVTKADDIDFNHADYLDALKNATGDGVPLRRELAVPIADCTGRINGDADLPLLGFGCYFLLQPATQKGNSNYIFGQFLDGCEAGGTAGPDPNSGPGPYLIQLYNDVQSGDS